MLIESLPLTIFYRKHQKRPLIFGVTFRYTYETAAFNGAKQSIFIVIPKEIILGRIVWPYIFNTVIDIAFVFYLL